MSIDEIEMQLTQRSLVRTGHTSGSVCGMVKAEKCQERDPPGPQRHDSAEVRGEVENSISSQGYLHVVPDRSTLDQNARAFLAFVLLPFT